MQAERCVKTTTIILTLAVSQFCRREHLWLAGAGWMAWECSVCGVRIRVLAFGPNEGMTKPSGRREEIIGLK